MKDADITHGNALPNEVKINFHMFGALMLYGVGGEIHRTHIVAVDKGGSTKWIVELLK